jgi:hypothetical protein
MRKSWFTKVSLLTLLSGTLFAFSYGACLETTVQRTVVGIAIG